MQELTWVAVGRAAGWIARSGSLWIAWYHGDPCPELPGNSGPWRSLGLMGALGGGGYWEAGVGQDPATGSWGGDWLGFTLYSLIHISQNEWELLKISNPYKGRN